MKYRAVIFDLFGTLIHAWSPELDEITLTEIASVLSVNTADMINMWRATSDGRMTGAFESYEICLREICDRLGTVVSDEQVRSAVHIRMNQTSQEMEPQDGAGEVLSGLRSQGYRIGLISNISMSGVSFWQVSRLMPLIDAAVLSCLEKTKKPDPHMYLTACQRLAVPPEKCLYIADGWDNELEAAASVGMSPVLIRHPGVPVSRDGSRWHGPVIRSLKEVFSFL